MVVDEQFVVTPRHYSPKLGANERNGTERTKERNATQRNATRDRLIPFFVGTRTHTSILWKEESVFFGRLDDVRTHNIPLK
jgi:hypothetical protein